jgi:hypothetical protein
MAGTANDALLADARAQFHLLRTGQAVRVVVDPNGERLEFNAANKADLAEYIRELEVLVGQQNLRNRRPLGFVL